MILELRTSGGQTVFPPSVYERDGAPQPLVWSAGSDIANVPSMPWEELQRRAGLLAFLALIASAYPGQGSREKTCFHLAGALVHAGLDPVVADTLVVQVAHTAGDEEAETRGGKAVAAAQKRADGEPTTGLPTLLAELGLAACEKRVRTWLGMGETKGEITPVPDGAIIVDRPDIHNVVADFATHLREKSGRVYRRGSELVRLSKLEDTETEEGIIRRAGLVELRIADANWLVHEASRCGGVFISGGGEEPKRVPPPHRAATILASVADEANFPVVRGIAMTPSLARDQPGYDASTKMLLEFPPGMFPSAPMQPTKEDAQAALARLEHPLRAFPFVDDEARAVALSAMLSAVVRGELSTCPLHAFDAPAPGSGKSKLADIVGILATGVTPSAITFSGDGEENEKRLATILRCGDPVILMDNVSGDVQGDFLCQMLTQENVQARVLGASERVRLSTRTLVLATGNNMRFKGDISRRVVVCRIDAKMSNPEDRQFDFDPVQEVKANRAALVVDALTILRAYRAAGEPEQLSAYGNFDAWSLIRGAPVWLGKADPVKTKQRATAENPEIEERSEILRAFYFFAGPKNRRTIAEIQAANGAGHDGRLHVALLRLNGQRDWNSKSIGHLLRRHRDVPFMGLSLCSQLNSQKVQTWWVEGEPEEGLAEPDHIEDDDIPF